MLRYKIAPKCLLPGPFGHSDVGGNPGVAGRFVAIISFLHTPVSPGRGSSGTGRCRAGGRWVLRGRPRGAFRRRACMCGRSCGQVLWRDVCSAGGVSVVRCVCTSVCPYVRVQDDAGVYGLRRPCGSSVRVEFFLVELEPVEGPGLDQLLHGVVVADAGHHGVGSVSGHLGEEAGVPGGAAAVAVVGGE